MIYRQKLIVLRGGCLVLKITNVDNINRLINEKIQNEECNHLNIYGSYKKWKIFFNIINILVAICIYLYAFSLYDKVSIDYLLKIVGIFLCVSILWVLIVLPIHEIIHFILTPNCTEQTYIVFSPPMTLSTISLCWMSKKRTLFFLIMPFLSIQVLLVFILLIPVNSSFCFLFFIYLSFMNLFSAVGDLFSAVYILCKLRYDCEILGMYFRCRQ